MVIYLDQISTQLDQITLFNPLEFGGNLRVDSRVGKGTRMTLLLPVADKPEDTADIEKAA